MNASARNTRDQNWASYVRRCATGDQAALSALYDETSRFVYGLALRVLRDSADAEEITIDVYAQVWRSAAAFAAQRGSVLSWLVTMARSRAIDRLRTQGARLRRKEDTLDAQAHAPADQSGTPEDSASLAQERKRVRQALDQLPPEQRELLELAYYSGLSHSELAARLGQPLGTVKTRIRLGMMRLRELLDH